MPGLELTSSREWFVRGQLPSSARWFLGATLVLLAGGLALLLSASSYHGLYQHGDPTYFLRRQFLGVLLGTVALCVGATVHPRVWVRWAPLIFVVCLMLLLFCLTQGKINGARRWIPVPFVGRFQPSELAKVAIPLFLAWCSFRFGIARPRGVTSATRYHLVLLGCVGFMSGLVLMQPDYGTGAFLLTVGGVLLMVAGLPPGVFVRAGFLMIPAAVGLFYYRREVVLDRFKGMLDPRNLHQVDQSLMGIQAGGWFGTGLGHGMQKTAIPYPYSDFIVAVLGEELGYVGFLALLIVLSLLLHAGKRVVDRCPDPALRLVGLAIVVNIVLQSCINIAVATAAAPTKGIGLPFISYGSTSLSVVLFQVGLLLGIARLGSSEDLPSPIQPAPEQAEDHADWKGSVSPSPELAGANARSSS